VNSCTRLGAGLSIFIETDWPRIILPFIWLGYALWRQGPEKQEWEVTNFFFALNERDLME
jgi:hypothetical protein